ncbi:cob(I)yrinic acid a,c-diamide adenosyltransferase [Pectinatus haikarae]|uniref:Cob(I)alamin adenosyltransferase n=1 Tax=Pectinatus haikarae TaxID=349096 RepID=A0ABT9Y8Z4_9FIRM|nr:cob(I)yrinic acid a,c-diamide adenosyltransferase [Pectinatus haikarae]MDQ0204001.1 cob(I)alamin adenosyltransferase [Pectinatus haikarae]
MLQVYTGNGKGKTTAAIGLSMRAIGAGLKVYFAQFMKSLAYSEQKILQTYAPELILKTSGKPYFIAEEGMIAKDKLEAWGDDVVVFPKGKPPADYVTMIRNGVEEVKKAAAEKKYDVVVLDEINVALFFGLIEKAQLQDLLDNMPPDTEVICTGRNAPEWLLEKADLVTEMKMVKHYYEKGVLGRKGIED